MANAHVLVLTHLLAAGAGYTLAPRELLETEVKSAGFFTTDTRRVLSAAVESLRAENRLLVYSYRGSAAVSVERDGLLFLDGRQDLIVPAGVGYYVDLSELALGDVSYDERSQLLIVRLPPLVMGDVAFEPEGARATSGGLLSFSESEVEELRKLAFGAARRAFVKQAQNRTLVEAAERQARENVEQHFGMALRIADRPDVRVIARFRDG